MKEEFPKTEKAHQVGHKKRSNTRTFLFLPALIFIIAIASTGILFLRDRDPIPKAIRQQANFSLYYPAGIPIDPGSIQLTHQKLLSYSVHYKGSIVYVTIQPKPQYFDFASFDKNIKAATTLRTNLGLATIGLAGGRVIGDLPTLDSWVLLSSQSSTQPSSIAYILKSLKKS